MAMTVTCKGVTSIKGKHYVRWTDKTEMEFASLAEAKEYVQQFAGDRGRDILRAMLLAKYLESDPTGANPALLAGKAITLDLSLAANIVKVI